MNSKRSHLPAQPGSGGLESIGNAITWAGHIDPHFILFVANTLIFIIVGVVIAELTVFTLNERAYIEQLWSTPKLLNRLVPIPVVGLAARGALLSRLALSYDIARGFVVAQEEIFKLVRTLASGGGSGSGSDGSQSVSAIEKEIGQNRIKGLNFLKNVREAYPEIARAVETKQAIRSVLNHERDAVKHLLNEGRIEADESARMLSSIEERMKMLNDKPPEIEYPEPIEFLKEVSWLKGLEQSIIRKVVDASAEWNRFANGHKCGSGDGFPKGR